MLRALVTGGFLLLAAIVLWSSFLFGPDTSAGNLLINMGTEIIGIVLTVAVVEWFFERRRIQNHARQLAFDMLNALEHAVWVWQGGPREMDTDEVRGVLNAVAENDPLPDFTESLFLNLGTRSRRLLNNEPTVVAAVPGFMDGLEHLSRLASMRDGKATMPSRKLADILDEATAALARTLGRPTERHLASLIRFREPSVQSQERRHFGGRGGYVPPEAAPRQQA